MLEIKFRALIEDILSKEKYWEYYTTLFEPVWIDSNGINIIIKDLQYINLKDKNKKEIYEGDILKHYNNKIGIVKFQDGCFWDEIGYFENHPSDMIKSEVIGNVYENEDLLKED